MASLWTKFTDIFNRNKSGVVPQAPSGTGTTKFLREDGTWAVPSGGGGGGSSALADLEDVNLNNPSDGQNLSYNVTSQKWENTTPSTSGHNYSTTEQVVGTWIDGKPVYEIVITFGELPTNSAKQIDISSLNVDELIELKGMVKSINTQGYYRPLPMVDNSSFSNCVRLDVSGYALRVITSGSWAGYEAKIILQYTKTTD